MTTNQLIELQRAITQGGWKTFAGTIIQDSRDRNLAICPESFALCGDALDGFDETRSNAKAIALVPQLLSEAIKLREALSHIESQFISDLENNE